MNLTFDFDDANKSTAKLKVVGVGGAGGNAISRMIVEGLGGVEFVAINTDEQALTHCKAQNSITVGTKTTQGLGAGADPEKGRRAIEEDRNAVYEALSDADMVFITAGMGGGTGTGAAPIVAEIAKDLDALTIGIVTKPFNFEGPKRIERAEEGIARLKERVDTLIVVPNQRLLTIVPKDTPLDAGFRYADEILFNATRGISDLITIPGLVNLDFADVRSVMSEMGDALMGCASAQGADRAKIAAEHAINSPLLEEISVSGALGLLVNITGGPDLTLHEVSEAASIISEEAGNKANLIFGAVIDKKLEEEIRITVIATGLTAPKTKRHYPGLNRTHYEVSKFAAVNRKEIPAIDRADEIGDNMAEKTNVTSFASMRSKSNLSSTMQFSAGFGPNGNGEKGHVANGHSSNGHGSNGHNSNGNGSNGNGVDQREIRNEPEKPKNRFEDIVDEKSPEKELDDFRIREENENGFAEDDYEIPAYRRKKWKNFF